MPANEARNGSPPDLPHHIGIAFKDAIDNFMGPDPKRAALKPASICHLRLSLVFATINGQWQ